MGMDSLNVQAMAWLLLAIFALAGGVNQCLSIIDRWRGKPPAGELLQGHTLLNIRVDKLETNMADLDHRVAAKLRDMEISNERRAVALHERINPMQTQIGELSGILESNTQLLARIDTKIDRLNERVSQKS